MIDILGIPVKSKLPLEFVSVLEEFDGITLMQKMCDIDSPHQTYLKTWVDTDRKSKTTRYLVFRCDEHDLSTYLNNEVTLLWLMKQLLPNELVFFIDEQGGEEHASVMCVFAKNIPETYMPMEESWYE